ncbi:MAG: C10 family peptidase [Prevotella sp.]|nr:C10 family peptidase [Prevotella sp.]
MKKVLFTLFVLAMPLMMMAEPIGQDKALQIACQFMAARANADFLGAGSMNGRKAAPAHRVLSYKDIGMKNLHAFADEANGGFVVVAGDDRVEPVLAYSVSDELNVYNMPTAMQVMLLSFDQQIGKLRQGNPTVRKAAAVSSRQAIAPLIKTMWHQYLPLNYNCPYDKQSERNKLVGCVALTLGQLMYYYQYPKSTKVTIPAYTTARGDEMPELPPTTFDYSKMYLNYDYVSDAERNTINPNDPSLEEVTKLLLYAGCALEMQYSTMGSAAVFDNALIAKYFGYDKGARYLLAGNYPHDVWEEMVYQELKAGRPVPYSAGAVGNQSHQFIIDGYDGMGLFHTNFGEPFKGSSDSFFRLGVLNECDGQTTLVEFSGYNVNQAAYFGFQPDKGNDPVPVVSVDYGNYSLSKTEYTRSSSSADFKDIVLGGTMTRYDNNGKTMDYGWGLFQNGLLKKELCSSTTSQENTSLNLKFNMGSQLTDGTYQLFPIFRNHGAKSWEEYLEYRYTTEDGTPMRHYTATITNNRLTIGVSSTEPNLKVNKVQYFAAYEGEKLDMRVWLTNNGTNYENEVFLWIDNEEYMRTGVGAYIDPGKSDYIDFCTAAPSKGTHKVKVTTDWEGKKTIYTGQFTVTDPPEYNLEPDFTLYGVDENQDVHNTLHVVLKITNKGNTTFSNMIQANLQEYMDDGNGHIAWDDNLGIPSYPWKRMDYLYIEPGKSTEVSYTLGREVLKPNDYLYSMGVIYYNNKQDFGWLMSIGYFNYFDDASGIHGTSVQTIVDDGIYYDLQGRRVHANQLKHGVYIHNNKKMLIK